MTPEGASLLAGVRTTGQPSAAVFDLLMDPRKRGPLLIWPLLRPPIRKHFLPVSLLCPELGQRGDCYAASMSPCRVHWRPSITTGWRNIVQ